MFLAAGLLDFKLLCTLRRCWRRHRGVTAAHVTGSATLGSKQFYYATVTMAPVVVTWGTGLWIQQIILN